MTRLRVWSALALAAGLFLVTGGTSAQQPRFIPLPKQPRFVQQPPAQPMLWVPPAELPVIPKSAGAFLSIKVSDVMDHPDFKGVLEQLKKSPEAFEGARELFGVLPNEMERITLFWPAVSDRGPGEPVVVLTTREPYNEARILKYLQAEPVYEDGPRNGRSGFDSEFRPGGGASGNNVKSPAPAKSPDFEPAPTKTTPKPKEPSPPPKLEENPERPEVDATTFITANVPADPLFYGLHNGPFEMLFMVDERTLVFLPGGSRSEFTVVALLAQMMQKKQTGPLAEAITAAGNHTVAGGVYLPPLFRELDRHLPPEMAPYAALTAAKVGTITADLGKTAKFTLKLTFDDAAAARRAAPVMEEGLKAVADKITEHIAEAKEGRQKALVPLMEAGAAALKKAVVKAEGSTVIATSEIDAAPAAGKAVAELLQSLSSRKKYVLRSNNLKQIGLAMHNYFSAYNKLPANIYGPKGELLLSWRVQLLPYLEQSNLYNQFKMDEAWDGPNNKKLIELMPKVFDVAGRDAPKGQTFYQAFLTPDPSKPQPKGVNPFTGRTWLIENDKVGQSLLVPDGTSNTIGVVEARTSVIWSKPDDLLFGEKLPPLGEEKADVFQVLMLDGSVRTLSTKIKPETLRILIDGYDGMVIPSDVFDDDQPRGFPLRTSPSAGRAELEKSLRDFEDLQKKAEVENTLARVVEIQRLEAQVAEARAALEKEKVAAVLTTTVLERVNKLFADGAAKKEEVDQAKAAVDEARARVKEREKEVQQVEDSLKTQKGALEKDGPASTRPVKMK